MDLDQLIQKANLCLIGNDQKILKRERYDLFYKGLQETQQRELKLQNCDEVESSIRILENMEIKNEKHINYPEVDKNPIKGKSKSAKSYCTLHKWCHHTTNDCKDLTKNQKKGNPSKTLHVREYIKQLDSIVIDGNISNMEVSFIVDTGSHQNIMSYKQAKELNLNLQKLEYSREIQIADGNGISIEYETNVSIHFDDLKEKIEVHFLIAQNFITEIILGMKFLTKNSFNILITENALKSPLYTLKIANQNSSLSYPDQLLSEKSKCLNINKERIENLVTNFLKNSQKIGQINNVEHKIKLKNDDVIVCKPYGIPLKQQKIFKEKINELLEAKIIRKSTSSIVSPCFAITKPDNDIR